MLGKDLYKIEVNAELSNERLRSLVFFYGPLIGDKALVLYEYLVLRGNRPVFEEINELLMSVNLSIDDFEFFCIKLNEYRLLKTLKQENRYIFALNNPLEIRQFIKDDIMVRNFILNTSGEYFRQLTADIYEENDHYGFEDVSSTLSLDTLQNWDKEGESYLKKKPERNYDFDTMFDVNVFLKDISLTLLPMRFRTKENMKQLALMADLYNISYDKMRTYLPKVARTDSNEFDLKELRYLCMNAKSEYKKVENDSYDVPCIRFLMSFDIGGLYLTGSTGKQRKLMRMASREAYAMLKAQGIPILPEGDDQYYAPGIKGAVMQTLYFGMAKWKTAGDLIACEHCRNAFEEMEMLDEEFEKVLARRPEFPMPNWRELKAQMPGWDAIRKQYARGSMK